MASSAGRRARSMRAGLALLTVLVGQLAVPGLVRGATLEVYTLVGYEVFYTPTVATFVGASAGSASGDSISAAAVNELSAWYTSIEHSVSVSPTGTITGGWAFLQRIDGVRISGQLGDGVVRQTNEGPGCTNESHEVMGVLYGVSRSDRVGNEGAGIFQATLIHHRAWLFGQCITYSASMYGTITVAF